MLLSDLKPVPGSHKKAKRFGRGRSSGHGKTSGKGQKGQKAHGKMKKPGFEGGQTPMQRKFPKRGFTYFGRQNFAIVNVGQLDKIRSDKELTVELLKKHGVIADEGDGLRVLGTGELKQALVIHAKHFSKSAIAKIEGAGGKAVVVK